MEADSTPQAVTSRLVAGRVAQVRERLRHRAWVFDDPRSYTAGVEEALQALSASSWLPEQPPVPASSVAPGPQSHTA